METKSIFISIWGYSKFKAKFTLVLLIEICVDFSIVFFIKINYSQLRIEKKSYSHWLLFLENKYKQFHATICRLNSIFDQINNSKETFKSKIYGIEEFA